MTIILIFEEIIKSHDKEQVSGARVHRDVGRGSRPGYSYRLCNEQVVVNSGTSRFRPQFILPYRVQDFKFMSLTHR